MKNLIIILATILSFTFTTVSFGQGLFSKDGSIEVAIESSKDVSIKDIKSELCGSKHPQQLLTAQYELVKKTVAPALKEIKSDYDVFSTKNAEKMSQKKFKIDVKNTEIKGIITEYLTIRRGVFLEKNQTELDSVYVSKITTEILKQYYLVKLVKAVEETANEWLLTEEENNYIPFLKMKTLHPKVKDETILMNEMAIEYLFKKQETLLNVYKCLIQTNEIILKYGVGSVAIKSDSKNKKSFYYIESLEMVLQNFFVPGNIDKKKQKMVDLYKEISNDIEELIENSTGIQ